MNDPKVLLGRPSAGAEANLADTLRTERAAVGLLLLSTAVALVWANSPWRESYASLSGYELGLEAFGLQLTVAHWATDGLLAIFFFVVGLELKRELVTGELRRPATAIVPIAAAVGGMAIPALLYAAVNALAADGAPEGWAVPVATDIAFAVAVLSAFGRRLPTALRAFLLTLAVTDDLLGIVVIVLFYSELPSLAWLAGAAAAIAAFALLVRTRWGTAWLLVPLAVVAWACMHASGIHATIAGVLLGFAVPALRTKADTSPRLGAHESLAERYEHLWRPVSAGLAVPAFALFAAGVTVDPASLRDAAGDPAAQGVALGLFLGKPLGILVATALVARFTRARLAPGVSWWDIGAVSVVAGIGFTVSLLIGELSFSDSSRHESVKAAVLIGSLASAVLGGALLSLRSGRVAAAQQRAASLERAAP